MRKIYVIADEIVADWKKINFAAQPYLSAMAYLESLDDMYILDDGPSVVMYFLSNSSTWHGETARRIKAELHKMLKDHRS